MKKISFKLKNKRVIEFIIDNEDYDIVKNKKLTIREKPNGNFYIYVLCFHKSGAEYYKSLHRLILHKHELLKEKFHVDHIDRNPLNNQKNNLRLCTNAQNHWNTNKIKKKCSSKYKGVRQKTDSKWTSQIKCNGKLYYLGEYKTEREAGIAYNIKAKELFGEFSCLNIIKDVSTIEEQTIKNKINNIKNVNTPRYITYKGITLKIREWSKILKIKKNIISNRLTKGWTVEDSLETPVRL